MRGLKPDIAGRRSPRGLMAIANLGVAYIAVREYNVARRGE